jgi:hypothetical protein
VLLGVVVVAAVVYGVAYIARKGGQTRLPPTSRVSLLPPLGLRAGGRFRVYVAAVRISPTRCRVPQP